MVRFWRWGKLRDGKKGRISRVLPVGRGVYWGFWEASQKLPAKREFLGTSVEEKRLPVMGGLFGGGEGWIEDCGPIVPVSLNAPVSSQIRDTGQP